MFIMFFYSPKLSIIKLAQATHCIVYYILYYKTSSAAQLPVVSIIFEKEETKNDKDVNVKTRLHQLKHKYHVNSNSKQNKLVS